MSEPSQSIRIAPAGSNPQPAAENILRLFNEGNSRVPADLTLPNGQKLRVWLKKESKLFRKRLTISLDEIVWGCRSCHAAVEAIKLKGVTVETINELLEHASRSVQDCKNCSKNGGDAGSGVSVLEPTPAVTPIPAAAESAVSRVKVIPADAGTAMTVTPAAQQTETKSQIKISNQGGTKGSGGTVQVGRKRPTVPSVPGHVHYSVSLSYFYERTRVEVTIPHHICEELVNHCGGSNQHKNEVGGLLVGLQEEVIVEGHKQFRVVVTDLIRLKAAASSVSHLEVSADEWARVGAIIEEKYTPQKKVRLGWYHTHPTQGIFFSPQDIDTHSIFKLPYQFGLVISPREMVAGLIYWAHPPTGASEPITFPLKRSAQTFQGQGGGPRAPRTQVTEVLPILKGRVVFVVWMSLMVLLYVITTSPPGETTAAKACLLAFNVFVILRLMNAQYFRPFDPFERRMFEVTRDTSQAFVGWFNGWSPLSFVYTAILVLGGLLVFTLVNTQIGWAPSQLWAHVAQPVQSQTQRSQLSGGGENPGNNQATKQLRILRESDSKMIVYFEDNSVAFYKMGNTWSPESLSKEQEFFRRTFNLEVNEERSVRSFQQWAYADNRSPDGRWGEQTRNVVLNVLLGAQRTGRPLKVQWRNDQPEFAIHVR